MKKETSNERLRRVMRRIQSGETDKDEDSIEELEKQFALRRKQLEENRTEEGNFIRKSFMKELERINEKLDNLDRKLEQIKLYLPRD